MERFGLPMPISGVLKVSVPVAVPIVQRILAVVALGATAVGCAWAVYASREGPTARETGLVLPLVGYVASLEALAYGVRGVVVSEHWTLAPHLLLGALAVAFVMSHARARWWLRPAIALALAAHVLFAAVTWRYRLDPESFADSLAARRTADWLRSHTPANAVVAGWDVGFIAAFADRRLINLEGLVNSLEFKQRWLDRDEVEEYLVAADASYLAQRFFDNFGDQKEDPIFEGVHLGAWIVEHTECASIRGFRSPRTLFNVYDVVMSHRPGGQPFAPVALHELCRPN